MAMFLPWDMCSLGELLLNTLGVILWWSGQFHLYNISYQHTTRIYSSESLVPCIKKQLFSTDTVLSVYTSVEYQLRILVSRRKLICQHDKLSIIKQWSFLSSSVNEWRMEKQGSQWAQAFTDEMQIENHLKLKELHAREDLSFQMYFQNCKPTPYGAVQNRLIQQSSKGFICLQWYLCLIRLKLQFIDTHLVYCHLQVMAKDLHLI